MMQCLQSSYGPFLRIHPHNIVEPYTIHIASFSHTQHRGTSVGPAQHLMTTSLTTPFFSHFVPPNLSWVGEHKSEMVSPFAITPLTAPSTTLTHPPLPFNSFLGASHHVARRTPSYHTRGILLSSPWVALDAEQCRATCCQHGGGWRWDQSVQSV